MNELGADVNANNSILTIVDCDIEYSIIHVYNGYESIEDKYE